MWGMRLRRMRVAKVRAMVMAAMSALKERRFAGAALVVEMGWDIDELRERLECCEDVCGS
jgi:hypothetical protein